MIWPANAPIDHEALDAGLHLFSTVDPKSSRGKRHYCYLACSERGNILLHPPDAPGFYERCSPMIDGLGGVRRIFLTHDGDDSPLRGAACETWGAELYAHAAELRRLGVHSGAGFLEAHDYDPDTSVALFPGHTEGYACLVRRRDGVAYLCAGHLLIRGKLGWSGAASARLFAESLASLTRLEALDVDYLMPEHTWSDAGRLGRAPLAFGPDVRASAVASAREGLVKKATAKRA